MMFDNRMGTWCLCWWQGDPLGVPDAQGQTPAPDKHKAPTHPRIRPLSLLDVDAPFLPLPYSVVKIHQDEDDAPPFYSRS
jgi:hypothetical protein